MRLSLCGLVLTVLMLAGCGQEAKTFKGGGSKDAAPRKDAVVMMDGSVRREAAQAGEKVNREPAAPEAPAPVKKVDPRKLIYTGRVELIVDDFDQTEKGLNQLLKELDGYIAGAEVTGEPGEPRWGTWTLRIPAGSFEEFLTGVKTLGELRKQTRDTQDVSDVYYDTKAVVANLEAREEALRKLYKEKIAGSKLSELLEVDRELSNVRTEINVRKGQLQRWDKLVEYATITLNIRDRKGYVPPTSPDFGTSIGRTFSGSIDVLLATGKALLIALVALVPWLTVFAILGAMVVVPTRLYMRKNTARTVEKAIPVTRAEPPPPPTAQPQPPPPPTQPSA